MAGAGGLSESQQATGLWRPEHRWGWTSAGHSDPRDSPGETLLPQGLDGNAGDVHRHQTERELLEGRVKGQWSVSSGLVHLLCLGWLAVTAGCRYCFPPYVPKHLTVT